MSEYELNWLELAREDNNKYQISVDNDCVFINTYDPDTDDWECVFTFDSYGQDFIVNILNYIGCNADWV